jgi:EAL domain-containing protein (putative c-di-GMP-specific phosphodiesterase class I)
VSSARRPPESVQTPAPAQPGPPAPDEDTVEAFARGTEPSLPPLDELDIAHELRELESKFDRCLATIVMHFQPIVIASSRARFGYEALLRATDQTLSHPGPIIDVAERLERVHVLGRAIRSSVAEILADAPPERGLFFVNLHSFDLSDKQLTSSFAPLSKVASRVCLEITEGTSLDGETDIQYKLAELRDRGFKIAIARSAGPRSTPEGSAEVNDVNYDLGGSYTRMGTFTLLDTDFIKLDMSLVRDIHLHPVKQRLVRTLSEMCHEHGTQVIGEGVEDEAEAQTLTELGVDLLQGYLFGRPALPFRDPL